MSKIDVSKLRLGGILSETSFFIIKGIESGRIQVEDDSGNDLTIGIEYVKDVLKSADIYEQEEKRTITELADIFINTPRIAMTVAYYKKDTEKTKKDWEAEKAAKIEEINNAKVSEVPSLLNNLIENPISKIIPGELRVMKGRHYGEVDDLGRVRFVDMEISLNKNSNMDNRLRLVDPRTISYIIVDGIKYSLKK
jgi:hypothetical protein